MTPLRERPAIRTSSWLHSGWTLPCICVTSLILSLILVPSVGAGATGTLRTFVDPSAGYGFLDRAVLGARHTIDLSMYELEDATMEADLVARARAGVDVRVLLDSEYGIKDVNAPAAAVLTRGGVHVAWAPSSQIFHAKYFVIDGSALYIGTGNLTAQYYSSTRDFWVLDQGRADVDAASTTFSADFSDRSAPLSTGSGDLVWSPGSTNDLVSLIESARHTLLVENEEMDSSTIEAALAAAARRGVDVKVVMTYSSQWHSALTELAAAGVHVHVLESNQVYIHAKVICADCSATAGRVFVGSENFSTSSLDYNRELGILTSATSVVRPVEEAVSSDYAAGDSNY
jgi:cardiolipin synthase